MEVLKLGAPSLTGKGANDLVKVHFDGAEYPLKLRFTNLIFMALSFPEVSGLFMKPVGHDGEESVVVEIKDKDALLRLASSIEQIAELNGKEELLEVSVYDGAAEVAAADAVSTAAAAAAAAEKAKAAAAAAEAAQDEADEAERLALEAAENEAAINAAAAEKSAAAAAEAEAAEKAKADAAEAEAKASKRK